MNLSLSHILFRDITWMCLALPNLPDISAEKMCMQPWAVGSQHTNDAPIGILCSRPDTTGTKGLSNTLWEQRAFSKRPWLNVLGMCQVRYCSANWTSPFIAVWFSWDPFINFFWGFVESVQILARRCLATSCKLLLSKSERRSTFRLIKTAGQEEEAGRKPVESVGAVDW